MEDKELDEVAAARRHQPAEAQRQAVDAGDVGHQRFIRPLLTKSKVFLFVEKL